MIGVWKFVAFFLVLTLSTSSPKRVHVARYDINYYDNHLKAENWEAKGSAMGPDRSGSVIARSPWEFGSLWNKNPVNFSNWELDLLFKIEREKDGKDEDGLGVFYVREPKLGATFGANRRFVGLAIIIDTKRDNTKSTQPFPRLQAHVLNGSRRYDIDTDGSPSALADIHSPIIGKPLVRLNVKYQNETLKVFTRYRREGSDPKKLSLWTGENFTVNNVHLPKGYFFGLGAACSEFCSVHRILSMNVSALDGREHDYKSQPFADPASSPGTVHLNPITQPSG